MYTHHACPFIIHIWPLYMSSHHTVLSIALLFPARSNVLINPTAPPPRTHQLLQHPCFCLGTRPYQGSGACEKNSRRNVVDVSRTPFAPFSNIGACVSHGSAARKIGYFFAGREHSCAPTHCYSCGVTGEKESLGGVGGRLFFSQPPDSVMSFCVCVCV